MIPTFYIKMENGKLRDVRCMKCNTFLYDFGSPKSVKEATRQGLPKHHAILLTDGSYTDVIFCAGCKLEDVDLPKMEATFKYGLMQEIIKSTKSKEPILKTAKWLRSLGMVRRIIK